VIVGCKKNSSLVSSGKVNYDYKFDVVLKDVCDNKITEYYKGENEIVYFVCLKELYVEENGKTTLKKYLNQENSLNVITDKMDIDTNDEDATIYRDKLKILSPEGFTMIKCHKSKNVYLGPVNLDYQESFCKSS